MFHDLGITKYIYRELGSGISTMLGINIQISREVGLNKIISCELGLIHFTFSVMSEINYL